MTVCFIFTFPNFSVLTPVNWFKIIIFHQYRRVEGKGISVQTAYTVYKENRPKKKPSTKIPTIWSSQITA